MSSLQILKRKSKDELLTLIPITGELIELLVIEEYNLKSTNERKGPDAFFESDNGSLPIEIKSQTFLGATLLSGSVTYSRTNDISSLAKQNDYVVVVGSCGVDKETYYQFGFNFIDIKDEYVRRAEKAESHSVVSFNWSTYWEVNSFTVLWVAAPHILNDNKHKFTSNFYKNLIAVSEEKYKKTLPL